MKIDTVSLVETVRIEKIYIWIESKVVENFSDLNYEIKVLKMYK